MARFYGWSPYDIDNLDVQTAQLYWQAIDVIEAGEVLLDFTIQDYLNLKDDTRKAIFKRFDSKIKNMRKSTKDDKKLSNKELMELLSRR